LGSFSLEGNTLTYTITFSGLSAPATAAHIHGPTNTTGSIGVIVPFANVPSATAGTISGTTTVSDTIKGYLLSGLAYANIHNTNNGGGEIRGQIGPTQLKATLNGDNERPTPVVTAGTGTGALTRIGNQLLFNISYSGLSSAANAAHIHGRADTTQFAGVLMGLPTPSGTSGTISGLLTLDNATLSAIVDGVSYLNIHTANNQGGEIRGQITP
jgi:CHRD domain